MLPRSDEIRQLSREPVRTHPEDSKFGGHPDMEKCGLSVWIRSVHMPPMAKHGMICLRSIEANLDNIKTLRSSMVTLALSPLSYLSFR